MAQYHTAAQHLAALESLNDEKGFTFTEARQYFWNATGHPGSVKDIRNWKNGKGREDFNRGWGTSYVTNLNHCGKISWFLHMYFTADEHRVYHRNSRPVIDGDPNSMARGLSNEYRKQTKQGKFRYWAFSSIKKWLTSKLCPIKP